MVAELEGTIVLPKKLSLGIAVGFVLQLVAAVYWFGTAQATSTGDIERLKRDVAVVSQINERTIRMEEQLRFIKAALEREAARH